GSIAASATRTRSTRRPSRLRWHKACRIDLPLCRQTIPVDLQERASEREMKLFAKKDQGSDKKLQGIEAAKKAPTKPGAARLAKPKKTDTPRKTDTTKKAVKKPG